MSSSFVEKEISSEERPIDFRYCVMVESVKLRVPLTVRVSSILNIPFWFSFSSVVPTFWAIPKWALPFISLFFMRIYDNPFAKVPFFTLGSSGNCSTSWANKLLQTQINIANIPINCFISFYFGGISYKSTNFIWFFVSVCIFFYFCLCLQKK